MQRRKVVLPDPEGPMMQTTSAGITWSVTSISAGWLPKLFPTLIAEITAPVIAPSARRSRDRSAARAALAPPTERRRQQDTTRLQPSGARSLGHSYNRCPARYGARR